MLRWQLITGEYPPAPGGVSDYTALLARALAEAGDLVEVWAPQCPGQAPSVPGVTVHRLPGRFGPRALARLGAALHGRRDDRVLVQYVPHMYGWRAMNLAFCSWLLLRCPLPPWVMFHEVTFPCAWGQRLRHNVLGTVNHVMAAMVARAAERIFVSTLVWRGLLRRLAPGRRPIHWLPVPSNVATRVDSAAVAALRTELGGGDGRRIIGHFGTFGGMNADLLMAALPPLLLADAGRLGLLVGRGSIGFAEQLVRRHSALDGRVLARGEVHADLVAAHLKACDLLVQTYPDGASSRRGSLMAGLALGVPAVTTHGFATEPVWEEEGLVALAPSGDCPALVAAAEQLLADPRARHDLSARGVAGYARHFDLENTVRVLRAQAAGPFAGAGALSGVR
jgi:glycosyltransferase involved in cell wall biosynthesis